MKEEEKTKFTPGPWYIKPRQLVKRDGFEWYTRTTILDDPTKAYSQRHVIATVARSNGREDANAALISAAPEMYDILYKLYNALAAVPVLQVEIDNVLKKARGEE